MEQGKQKLTYWLMPAEEAKAAFTALVHDLAERLGAPAFEPHVTLQAAALPDERAIELLGTTAATHAPLELQVAGLEFSQIYTKTLYVQFRPSAVASAISDAITRVVGGNGYRFDPHLSLLYKTLPDAAKAELARKTKISLQQVRFDAVQLVRIPQTIEGPEDVLSWGTIAERPLTGTSK